MEPDRFFTLALDMLCVADFDGYFRRLNPAWERTLGWSSAELQTRPYLDFVHPDDRAATTAEAEKLTTGRDTLSFENRYLCKDGSYRWLLWSAPLPRPAPHLRRRPRHHRPQAGRGGGAPDGGGVPRRPGHPAETLPTSQSGAARLRHRWCLLPARGCRRRLLRLPPLAGGGLGVALSDVAGHGVGPALLTTTTRASLHALRQTEGEIGTLLTLTNRLLADIVGDRFVTLVLARLDPGKRSLVYASAGHPAGYVLDRSGAVETRLESLDPPLGAFPEHVLTSSATLTLEPGELVLLLTDGFLEACSPDGTAFGAERALGVLRANRHRSARDIVLALYQAVRAFSGNRPQLDDITAVVIKVG
jgi:PAS domain S-box-containing protein